jgi:hypothetical protein
MAEDVTPIIGQALSFAVTLIVLNELDPGLTMKQKVAVAGLKYEF